MKKILVFLNESGDTQKNIDACVDSISKSFQQCDEVVVIHPEGKTVYIGKSRHKEEPKVVTLSEYIKNLTPSNKKELKTKEVLEVFE